MTQKFRFSGRVTLGLAVIGIVLFIPQSVFAQSSARSGVSAGQKISLSLEQAVEYALDHNRTLKNASLDIRKAEAAKWQSVASMLPQISTSIDYSNYFGYKMDLGEYVISMPPYMQMGLTTAVGFSGASIVGIQIANISKKMADINLEKSERTIRDQVKLLYNSALVTEESIRILEANLASLNRLYDMTRKSVEVGAAEQTDADQLKVQVSSMEATVSSTRRTLEMVYNSIRIQLCLEQDVQLELTDELGAHFDKESAYALTTEGFDIKRNYDYALLKESTDLAKKQIALSGWSGGPTLSIYHQYTAKQYLSDEKTMNMTPPNMMGVSLTIPLFTSLKNTAAVREARISYQEQLNTMEDTELALKVQYSQLAYNLKSALERFENQTQNVEVAQRVFDNVALKYETGYSSSMDVVNSQTSLLTAQSNYVQAMYEIVQAQIELEQLLNR